MSWISTYFERFRRAKGYFTLLESILGPDIKQFAQQIHWKPPGAGLPGYRFHQDFRFRAFALSSYVRAGTTERGEWAFRNRVSTPIGDSPRLCKFERLHENPDPHYVEGRWYA